MLNLHTAEWVLLGITLVAATVNGGLGYGFSSITVPVALMFFPNRVLNQALVLAEVVISLAVFGANHRAWRRVGPQALPLILGLVPGVLLGSWVLAFTGSAALKVATYLLLLPFIIAQSAGVRWQLKRHRGQSAVVGAGVGLLYASTTISGPPLALFFNNQGLAKEDFRAALGLVRIAESSLTAVTYLGLGLYSHAGLQTTGLVLPGIALGLPLGHLLLIRLPPETFRRVCMGVDALLVSFGLARTVVEQRWIPALPAYLFVAAIVGVELFLVQRYLKLQRPASRLAAASVPLAAVAFAKVEP